MKYDKVYVFCPVLATSGGPDALHQMVFYLNKIGVNASLVYFGNVDAKYYKVPLPYASYVQSFEKIENVIDNEKNAIVIPEAYEYLSCKYFKASIYIWWLSVDNNFSKTSFFWKIFYLMTIPIRMIKNFHYYKKSLFDPIIRTLRKKNYDFKRERKTIVHLCASHYANAFISNHSKNKSLLCIEPISRYFLDEYEKSREELLGERDNIILYNPKKSNYVVQCLASFAKDLKFEPLTGLNQFQLVEKYKKSKLYVDFGPFPGAERMPKEAVLFGCSILTGRQGASGFYNDVPISDEYKFEKPVEKLEEISQKIREMLKHYEEKKCDFDEYRKTVLNLENGFRNSLKEIFLS